MKYTDLSDKERYEIIKLGVQNGITNLDDIEKAYNEFAEGGHVYATKGDLRASSLYGNPAQNFTNQMWNSKQMLDARLNSNDFLTQEEARREVERQKQFDESAKIQREKAGQFILKQAQEEWDRNHQDVLENPDAYSTVDVYKHIGKRPQTFNDVLKNYQFQDNAVEVNKIGLTAASLPYIVPTKGSSSLFNTFARSYNGADLVSLLKPEKEDTSLDTYITTNADGTQTYNPYKQMVDVNVANRNKKIQEDAAKYKAAHPEVTTTNTTPSTTTDTRVKVRTPQQTITQATQPIQQQAVSQKPSKMQGFMNKLGSAAPYIGDFVGWTLGNSRFFADGGDLSDEEKKQLEWSKNWHTQRVNYMPWTDEQKAAYLKAIDKTYSDNNFTRNATKPMGFYHKDGSININYDNANNTIYGDMAERSGLVHEIAHKLSFNANQEFNKIDNTIPEQEAATLRAKKLGKFVNPLEVGGVMNTRKFVDYNTDDKTARQQEKEFRNSGVYRYKNIPVDKYGHNAVEVKAKLDEARYRLNLQPSQMDINPESVEMWRNKGLFPPSLKDYSNEEIAKMLNTFAYNNNNNYSYENQG